MKTKISEQWIKAIYAIATIIIVVGLILRLLDIRDGYAISIIGGMIGLVAFIINNYLNKTKITEQWIKIIYAIAIIIIVVGLILRLLDIRDGYAVSIIGVMVGLVAFIISNYLHKTRNESVEEKK